MKKLKPKLLLFCAIMMLIGSCAIGPTHELFIVYHPNDGDPSQDRIATIDCVGCSAGCDCYASYVITPTQQKLLDELRDWTKLYRSQEFFLTKDYGALFPKLKKDKERVAKLQKGLSLVEFSLDKEHYFFFATSLGPQEFKERLDSNARDIKKHIQFCLSVKI